MTDVIFKNLEEGKKVLALSKHYYLILIKSGGNNFFINRGQSFGQQGKCIKIYAAFNE